MLKSQIGVSFKNKHYQDFINTKPDIGFIEIHGENYLSPFDVDLLLKLRAHYPVSLHMIGMSLGSSQGLSELHLQKIKELITKLDPFLVSDHLSWSRVKGYYLPELLPIPYNDEALAVFQKNITKAQEYLGREILIENPSVYLEFNNSIYKETEFLNILAKTTGAKILLDVNNVYVSCLNNGWDMQEYISEIDKGLVKEIHLAGHSIKQLANNKKLYVDSHDDFVTSEVWDLYHQALKRFGTQPTLLEWDGKIPSLETLISEAKKAERYLSSVTKKIKNYV
ncbi:MAG: DUF692 domain-containing protein [Rickettsiaceae bacterium]|nr:DUF692 domain-containing protein [Rickettsiaceae bacterium]